MIRTLLNLKGFSLVEILITITVLGGLILIVTGIVNSATTITRIGSKHMDTDAQARAVLDRIGMDLRRMIKRSDLDCYVKQPSGYTGHGNGHAYGHRLQSGEQGSDQMAFFSQVRGYYSQSNGQGPVSLIAYRVNQNSASPAYLRLERMAKGLLWNGVANSTNPNAVYPIVFLPATISGVNSWSAALSGTSQDQDYETIGPNVFRFEYYYLLKSGDVTDVPWDATARPSQASLTSPTPIGLTDVQAIAVAIAVIDSASRALIPSASLLDLASDMNDFQHAHGRGAGGAKKIGDMEVDWNQAVASAAQLGVTSAGSAVPPAAASGIRVYNRYFDLGVR